jgi:GDP-D-mannose 3', 5'-epimerase
VKLERRYDLTAPKGVSSRNSDNTFIRAVLGWEPSTPMKAGIAHLPVIEQQYHDRKAGGSSKIPCA